MSNPVQRVTSVLTDQLPKLEKMCDEVSAIGNGVLLRASESVHRIGLQFKELDAAVTELDKLAGLSNSAGYAEATEPGEGDPGPLPDLGPKLGP